MKKILTILTAALALSFVGQAQDEDNNTFYHPDRNWKGQIQQGGQNIYIWCFLGCVDACDNTSYPGDCDPICNQVCQPFIGNPGAAPTKPSDFVFSPEKMLMNLWQRLQVSWSPSGPGRSCARTLKGLGLTGSPQI